MNKSEIKRDLTEAVDFFKSELSKIRTGRASASLIEDIAIEVYGSKMRLKELGSITVPEPQLIVVSPWDRSQIPAISKAINTSELNLNSSFDNEKVRVPIPALSQERRAELAKLVSTKLESCKATIRNLRNDVMKSIDKQFTDKLLSEDEKFSQKEEADKIIKEYSEQADSIAEDKKKSLMEL
jgi:ribosome recycling factor